MPGARRETLPDCQTPPTSRKSGPSGLQASTRGRRSAQGRCPDQSFEFGFKICVLIEHLRLVLGLVELILAVRLLDLIVLLLLSGRLDEVAHTSWKNSVWLALFELMSLTRAIEENLNLPPPLEPTTCTAVRSLPSRTTISSIMLRTLSKLTFLLCSESEMSSRRLSWVFTEWRARSARLLTSFEVTVTCISEVDGRVFLKRSRASSSLRILMVSASASSSSARVFFTSSYSSSFVPQPSFRSARNFVSSARDVFVSSRSSERLTISVPFSPTRAVLSSMALELAAISFSLAATRAV